MTHALGSIVLIWSLAAGASQVRAADAAAVPPAGPAVAAAAAQPAVGAVPAPGSLPTPTMAQVLDVLKQAYVHHDGTFYGRVTTVMDGFTTMTEYQLTTLGSHFALSWRSPPGQGMPGHGQVITDGTAGHVVVFIGDAPKPFLEKDGSAEMVLAMAQGISGGCAMLLHDLWSGNLGQVLPQPAQTISVSARGVLVSGSSSTGGTSQVTLHPGHVLECHDELTHVATPTPTLETMSDDQVKESLEAIGLPATAQSIANMRSTMAMAQKTVSATHPHSISITTIVSEVPLEPLPVAAAPVVAAVAVAAAATPDPPMDLPHLTLTVNAARALGTTALTSHDIQTLMAAEQVVTNAEIAISTYQIDALQRQDLPSSAAVTSLDEPGLHALERQLSKLLRATLAASAPPGAVTTSAADP